MVINNFKLRLIPILGSSLTFEEELTGRARLMPSGSYGGAGRPSRETGSGIAAAYAVQRELDHPMF